MVQAAFDFYTEQKAQWLDEARWAMKKLLEKQPYVTSDDVHNVCPLPKNLHRNTLGAVFNNEFRSIGFQKSKREAAKGRWIQQWRLK